MSSCIFTNDGNVELQLIEHPFSDIFKQRDLHEVMFRRLHTFLIQKHILTKNFIDLGAWIGDNSIPWAKNTQGTIYAIDPSPENCQFIRLLAKQNLLSNVSVIQTAISDTNEVLSTNDDINHCSFVYNNTENQGIQKVNACSLDYLVQIGSIETIGYIHLDVEGMEFKILKGASTLLESQRPILTFEQHLQKDNYLEILEYLNTKKYRVFLLNEELPGCRLDCRNSIAFPLEMYSDTLQEEIHTFLNNPLMIPMNTIV